MHVDDLTFVAAAQILGSDNLYLGRPGDTADPDKRTDVDELITKLLGADAAGISPFYETGTFTPTLETDIGTVTVSYSIQEGMFIRIGKLVWLYAYVATTSRSGGAGSIRLGGAPYTAGGSTNPILSIRTANLPITATQPYYAYVRNNSNLIQVSMFRDGTPLNAPITSWADNASVIVTGTYFTP